MVPLELAHCPVLSRPLDPGPLLWDLGFWLDQGVVACLAGSTEPAIFRYGQGKAYSRKVYFVLLHLAEEMQAIGVFCDEEIACRRHIRDRIQSLG